MVEAANRYWSGRDAVEAEEDEDGRGALDARLGTGLTVSHPFLPCPSFDSTRLVGEEGGEAPEGVAGVSGVPRR